MSYYLYHFLELWLLPPGINLLLALIGVLCWRFWKLLGKSLIVISLMSLWVFSMPMVAQQLIDKLQYQYPAVASGKLKIEKDSSSAIVILAAGLVLHAPEFGEPDVSDHTLTRLRYAAYLHQKTGIPILVSGSYPTESSPNVAEFMTKGLKAYFGIAAKWKEDRGSTTALEGIFTSQILKASGISKIYLVTHALHMPRSVYAFQGKGFEIIPAPTGYITTESPISKIFSFLPTMDALSISQTALHEYIGLVWYYYIFNGKESRA